MLCRCCNKSKFRDGKLGLLLLILVLWMSPPSTSMPLGEEESLSDGSPDLTLTIQESDDSDVQGVHGVKSMTSEQKKFKNEILQRPDVQYVVKAIVADFMKNFVTVASEHVQGMADALVEAVEDDEKVREKTLKAEDLDHDHDDNKP